MSPQPPDKASINWSPIASPTLALETAHSTPAGYFLKKICLSVDNISKPANKHVRKLCDIDYLLLHFSFSYVPSISKIFHSLKRKPKDLTNIIFHQQHKTNKQKNIITVFYWKYRIWLVCCSDDCYQRAKCFARRHKQMVFYCIFYSRHHSHQPNILSVWHWGIERQKVAAEEMRTSRALGLQNPGFYYMSVSDKYSDYFIFHQYKLEIPLRWNLISKSQLNVRQRLKQVFTQTLLIQYSSYWCFMCRCTVNIVM